MKRSHKILLIVLILLVILQFFRPAKNVSDTLISSNDISKAYAIPQPVHEIILNKCYDCHSNTTTYPWYYNIQPFGMWMAHHINEGKEELNFSEFKTYSPKKANHKLEEMHEAVTEGWMPLDSYLWIHKDAKIEPQDADAINAWIKSLGVEFDKKE